MPERITHPILALGVLVSISLALASVGQHWIARAPPSTSRTLAALALCAVHFATPLCFDTASGAVSSAVLAATLLGWWGTMKVLALLLSGSGPLADFAAAPASHFWAGYFLPVTLLPPSGSGMRLDAQPIGEMLRGFTLKLGLLLTLLFALDPLGDGTPAAPWLGSRTWLGDGAWSLVVLLAASGLMDCCGAAVGLVLGLAVRPAFDAPLHAVSLCDFWGRRWNLTAVRLLRDCCYRPLRGKGLGRVPAALATFALSGAAHELIMAQGSAGRYGPRVAGRWCAFFVSQGALVGAEAALGLAHGPAARAGAGRLGALELALRRAACVALVLACARPLFLAPAYDVGWPWLLSGSLLAVPRRLLRAAGLPVPFAALVPLLRLQASRTPHLL